MNSRQKVSADMMADAQQSGKAEYPRYSPRFMDHHLNYNREIEAWLLTCRKKTNSE